MTEYIVLAAAAVALTAVSQMLLKTAAVRSAGWHFVRRYLNLRVLSAYTIFIAVTMMNVYAYKYLPIKMVVLFLPFTFVLVLLFSMVFLGERMNRRQLQGALIILAGVVLYNI